MGRRNPVGPSATPRARVTLVRPPILQIPSSFSYFGAVPPIGIAYVAASLRHAGHRVTAIDAPGLALDRLRRMASPVGPLVMQGLSPEEIVARIEPDTGVLGITHMFLHEWPMVREIAVRAKTRHPELRIVLGGENATAFWPWILDQCPAIDACVLGEGEGTAVELVGRLAAGTALDALPGIAYRDEEGVRSNSLSARRTDVDEIPLPAWDLLPVAEYHRKADSHGVHRGRSLPLLATRGCPYECTFCSSPDMWTTRYKTRAPRRVVDEMKQWVERYGVENFNFCDLTAIIRKDWIVEFCNLLLSEGLRITWQFPSGTRSEALDAEVLDLLYRSGARNVTYAPESGSERMLKRIKKRVKLPRMLDSLEAAHRVGMTTSVSIIIGHPAERREDVLESLRFLGRAARAGSDACSVMIFAPYPGSQDFQELLQAGRLTVDEGYLYTALVRSGRSPRTWNEVMGTRELIAWQWGLLVAFHGLAYAYRPGRFLEIPRALRSGKERTNVDQLLRTKLRQFREAATLEEMGRAT